MILIDTLVCLSIASTRVVLPWSTWATIAIFLISALLINFFFSSEKPTNSIKTKNPQNINTRKNKKCEKLPVFGSVTSEIEHLIALLFLEAIRRVGLEEDKGSPKSLLRLLKKNGEEEFFFGNVVEENNREFWTVSAIFSISLNSLTLCVKCYTEKRERKMRDIGEMNMWGYGLIFFLYISLSLFQVKLN